jgi:hypothetical protein
MEPMKKPRLRKKEKFWKTIVPLSAFSSLFLGELSLPSLSWVTGQESSYPLTRKGPCSVRNPSRELQPGPPLSQRTTGLLFGSFWDSTNLERGQGRVGAGEGVWSSLALSSELPCQSTSPLRGTV